MTILKSRYMYNVEFFEGKLELLDKSKVGCHLGVSGLIGFQELANDQLVIVQLLVPMYLVSESPTMSASYYASLFVAWKPQWI